MRRVVKECDWKELEGAVSHIIERCLSGLELNVWKSKCMI